MQFLKWFSLLGLWIVLAAGIFRQAYLTQTAGETLDREIRPLMAKAEIPKKVGPVYLENDSYYWLGMAERMQNQHQLKIKNSPTDNAPFGRPVYWSQSIAWLIQVFSKIPAFQGRPDGMSQASFWVNPCLQVISLGLVIYLLAPWGWRLTTISAVLFSFLGDMGWTFSSLRPDHQSLQAGFLIATLLLLLRAGFGFGVPDLKPVGSPQPERAFFIAAGGTTGAGLWISSSAMMPCLIVLCGAVMGVALWQRPIRPPGRGRGWVEWGMTAGFTSLGFWVLENWPRLDFFRLEVNSPAFAAWVLVLGLMMQRIFFLVSPEEHQRLRGVGMLAGLMALAGILPALILFGPVDWYQPRVLVMDRLHNFIMEFYTLNNFTKGKTLSFLWANYQFVLPAGLLLLVPVCKHGPLAIRGSATVLLLLTAGLFLMACRQIRWFALFAPVLSIAVGCGAGYLMHQIGGRTIKQVLLSWGVFFLGVLQALVFYNGQSSNLKNMIQGKSLVNEFIPPVLNKHFVTELSTAGFKPKAVMADPDLAPAMGYFGKFSVVASFYWENVDGIRDMAEFFGDEGEFMNAQRIARKRGISHIIVRTGPLFANYIFYLRHGFYDTARAKNNLAALLTQGTGLGLPAWIQMDEELTLIGKSPYVYRGEVIDQYLNVYRVRLDEQPPTP